MWYTKGHNEVFDEGLESRFESGCGMEKSAFPDLPEIVSGDILLRKIRMDDAEDLLECLSDPAVTERMMHCRVESRAAMEKRIAAYLREYENRAGARFGTVLRESGKMIGSVMLTPVQYRARAVLGFYLNPAFWGRGYAKDMVCAAINFGFAQAGLWRIEANCFVENLASAHVMEHCGMQCEGISEDYYFVRGVLRSVRRYAILKRDWEKQYGKSDAAR